MESRVIGYRRDLHRYAEAAWTEFRTSSLVARRLVNLGYDVQSGRQVLRDEARMGLPSLDILEQHWQRALEQGADLEYLEVVRGGFTGVVGVLDNGPGPVVGLRFDMDSVDISERQDSGHRPFREGFASVNDGASHACGHDGHTAIGLGVAEVLMALRDQVRGTVKLIFQPAEEGVRGGKAMVSAGVVDDVDYVLGNHLYSGWKLGEIDPGRSDYLATTKFDAVITGAPAHAGGRPHEGKNALLAASTAVLNLHAIPRHKDGVTRINVGKLVAGSGRNVVCSDAHLTAETRGCTSGLNDYMYGYAMRVLEAAASMHDCRLEVRAMGSAQSASSDTELADRVRELALDIGSFSPRPPETGGGSEDFTYMMERVQQYGGQATSIGIGADLGGWGHHTPEFDFDERALGLSIRLLSEITIDLLEG